jgi:hypothetical protein
MDFGWCIQVLFFTHYSFRPPFFFGLWVEKMEVIKQTTHKNMNIIYANIKLKLDLTYVVVSHTQLCHLTFSIVYMQHLVKIYKSIYPKNKWK